MKYIDTWIIYIFFYLYLCWVIYLFFIYVLLRSYVTNGIGGGVRSISGCVMRWVWLKGVTGYTNLSLSLFIVTR